MIDLYCDSDKCRNHYGRNYSSGAKVFKSSIDDNLYKLGMQCPDCRSLLMTKTRNRTAESNRKANFRAGRKAKVINEARG